MAVTKTPLVSVLVVLAITYNQGAARSVDDRSYITKNGLSSSEELQADSAGERTFKIPTVIDKGLIITINGTLNPNDSSFIVELPSLSGENNCQIKFVYGEKVIYITPAVEGYEKTEYQLNVTSGSAEGPSFSLTILARIVNNNEMFSMTLYNEVVGLSSSLICMIDNFAYINQIVIKKGVARVDSLTFEFESNR